MIPPDLVALLSALLAGEGQIRLSVALTQDEEINALREEKKALQRQIDDLTDKLDRAEYLFRCESFLNNALVDLCRANGLTLTQEFFQRPYSDEE